MTGRIVLDASAAIRVVLRQEGSDRLLDILDSTSLVIPPSLFCAEVANALWKYQSAGELSTLEGVELLELATSLVDEFIPDSELALEALRQRTDGIRSTTFST